MPVRVGLKAGASNDEALDDAFLYVQSWVDQKVNDVLDELNQ